MLTSANTVHSRIYTIVALCVCGPAVAHASTFAGGTGKPDDPYKIATAEQLISLGSMSMYPKDHFLLISDIDLDPNLPGRRVFDGAVIASGAPPFRSPFASNFNGGHRTIRNLVVRAKSQSNWTLTSAGLFGSIGPGGVVRDLKIEAADVQVVDRRVGILAGENAGRVVNCRVSGRVSSNFAVFYVDEVGGLVGRNWGDIINCQADTEGVWGYQYVGGLVGSHDARGTIAGCRAICKQVGVHTHGAGGLVGINRGWIIGSEAMGEILGQDVSGQCGGLTGINSGMVLCCQAGSDLVIGTQGLMLGGLAGQNSGTIANCYASGSISTQDQAYIVGGLVGRNRGFAPGDPGRIVNSYAIGKITTGPTAKYVGGLVGDNTDGEVEMSFWDSESSGTHVSAGGEGLATARMQQADTFLEAGWDFVDERANGVIEAWRVPEEGGYPVLTLGFDGYRPRRLAGAGTIQSPHEIATPEDLGILWRHDPSACYQLVSDLDLAGIRWTGAPIAAFNGMFDGGGHVISRLILHERRNAGLFALLGQDALVMDLGVADANIVGDEAAENLGILAGRNYGAEILRCYATGRLETGRRSSALGGLIGWNRGFVADCYARTDLSSGEKSSRLGGLLGSNSGTIKRSYAAGSVATPDPNTTCGGLLGAPEKTAFVGMIVTSYFVAPADGGGPTNGLGIPLTNIKMRQQASFIAWDFKNTWTICEGKDYPRLRWEKVDCDRP